MNLCDTERDPGAGRLIRSYRVGAPSVRFPGETWEQLERRLASLDAEARPEFERQDYLLVPGGGLTFTATSKHSSGRAVDVIVGDGNLKHQRTRPVDRFPSLGERYEGGRFRLIGLPEKSWDWPHIELRAPWATARSRLFCSRRRPPTCLLVTPRPPNPVEWGDSVLLRGLRVPVVNGAEGKLGSQGDRDGLHSSA